MTDTDTGARCASHVGEVFPPRCAACETSHDVPRAGFIPGSECPAHAGYPQPCVRCEREEAEL